MTSAGAALVTAPARGVVCDIDHTITTRSSVAETTRALGVPAQASTALYRRFRDASITPEELRTATLELWRSTGTATRSAFEAIFENIPVRPDAERLAQAVRERGLPLGLISSSAQLYADTMVRRLAACCGYGNGKLLFNEDGDLDDIELDINTAALKAQQLRQFAREHSLDVAQVLAIGNSLNDVPMLQACGQGILLASNATPHWSNGAYPIITQLDEAIPYIDH
ncbi:HAD-IB family phosphatase [Streptomyces sp. NPDC020096]